jgi:hypothetical protein
LVSSNSRYLRFKFTFTSEILSSFDVFFIIKIKFSHLKEVCKDKTQKSNHESHNNHETTTQANLITTTAAIEHHETSTESVEHHESSTTTTTTTAKPITINSTSMPSLLTSTTTTTTTTKATITASNEAETTTLISTSKEEEPFICPSSNGLFVNKKGCRYFWHCSNDLASEKECNDNLVFNPDAEMCDWTSPIC